MRGLQGETALVTGATGVIGAAVARRLGEEGATVLVASREAARAKRWVEQEGGGIRCRPVAFDLEDDASIKATVEDLAASGNLPRLIVANASLREVLSVPFREVGRKEIGRLVDADVTGHLLLARAVVDSFEKPAGMSVVFLSSVYGMVGADRSLYPEGMEPAPVQYAVAKAALVGLTRYLAALWGEKGVRVNAVAAGGVHRPSRQPGNFVDAYSARTMLGRMAEPEEVAAAVAFLSSRDASYVTGHCLVVDGGFTSW